MGIVSPASSRSWIQCCAASPHWIPYFSSPHAAKPTLPTFVRPTTNTTTRRTMGCAGAKDQRSIEKRPECECCAPVCPTPFARLVPLPRLDNDVRAWFDAYAHNTKLQLAAAGSTSALLPKSARCLSLRKWRWRRRWGTAHTCWFEEIEVFEENFMICKHMELVENIEWGIRI